MAKLFWALILCLIVMTHQTAADGAGGLKGKDLISKICTASPTKDLCFQVLSSDPTTSPKANLKDLAIIALKIATNNASGILEAAKTLIEDDSLQPDVQQGLADCKETILDAESQLEDTIAALLEDDDADAQVWLKAALAAIDTCDASIPGDDDILSVKSTEFRKLCNIVVAISNLMDKPNKS